MLLMIQLVVHFSTCIGCWEEKKVIKDYPVFSTFKKLQLKMTNNKLNTFGHLLIKIYKLNRKGVSSPSSEWKLDLAHFDYPGTLPGSRRFSPSCRPHSALVTPLWCPLECRRTCPCVHSSQMQWWSHCRRGGSSQGNHSHRFLHSYSLNLLRDMRDTVGCNS